MSGFGDLPVIVSDEGRGREFALRERNAGERERIGRMGMGRCRSEPPAAGHRRDQGKNLAGHPGLTALPCVASSDFGTGAAARRKPVNDGKPPGRNKTGTAAQYTYRPRFDRGVVAPRRLPGGQNGQAWVVRGRPPRERSSPLALDSFLRFRVAAAGRGRVLAPGDCGRATGPDRATRRGGERPTRTALSSGRLALIAATRRAVSVLATKDSEEMPEAGRKTDLDETVEAARATSGKPWTKPRRDGFQHTPRAHRGSHIQPISRHRPANASRLRLPSASCAAWRSLRGLSIPAWAVEPEICAEFA